MPIIGIRQLIRSELNEKTNSIDIFIRKWIEDSHSKITSHENSELDPH